MRSSSVNNLVAVTPDDDANLPYEGVALYVGTVGDVKITTPMGNTVTLVNLAAGVMHPISTRKVFATGTDATNIIIGW